jgi:hypothetical protein
VRWHDSASMDGNDGGLHRDIGEGINYAGAKTLEENKQKENSPTFTVGKGDGGDWSLRWLLETEERKEAVGIV